LSAASATATATSLHRATTVDGDTPGHIQTNINSISTSAAISTRSTSYCGTAGATAAPNNTSALDN
jgi:hypothetical protein